MTSSHNQLLNNSKNVREITRWMSLNGIPHFTRIWEPNQSTVKGCIQLIHGMVEHSGNYQHVGHALAQNGWITFMTDLIGHGETAKRTDTLGHFNNQDWNKLIQSQLQLKPSLALPNHLPSVVMGHSMGTFICQNMMKHTPHPFNGMVLIGPTYESSHILSLVLALFKWIKPFINLEAPASLIHPQIFGRYETSVHSRQTAFDWLSHDSTFVTDYINDPLCGMLPTYGFYFELCEGIISCFKNSYIHHAIPPIFIGCGDQDPVSNFSRKTHQLKRHLEKAGAPSVDLTIYKNDRHQILSSNSRSNVMSDIIEWLDHHIERSY